MLIRVFQDKRSLGKIAEHQASAAIRNAIVQRGSCRIVVATAASQREFLESVTADPNIDWSRVEAFHLDEYVGLPLSHPGSFRKMIEP